MAFSYKPYEESEAVKRARENLANIEAQRPAEWTGGTYGSQLKDAYDRINNREKFNYDFNADALYRQYKDQYMRQGLMAMQDAQAQSAALTGGFGNSYAVTAGNLAYQDYLSRIHGVIPELRNAAFQEYQAEGDDMADAYDRLRGLYNTEYGEYQDRLNVFNNERNYLYNLAQDLAKDDYDRYNDEYARALNLYNMNNVSSGGGGGRGGSTGKDNDTESPAATEPVTANRDLLNSLFGNNITTYLLNEAAKGNYRGIADFIDSKTGSKLGPGKTMFDEAMADAVYDFLKGIKPAANKSKASAITSAGGGYSNNVTKKVNKKV